MLATNYKVTVPEKFLNQVISQMIKVQNHFLNNVDGCIKYQFSQDLEDKTIIYLLVIWENQALYEENLDSEYQQKEVFDKLIKYNCAIASAVQFTISEYSDVA